MVCKILTETSYIHVNSLPLTSFQNTRKSLRQAVGALFYKPSRVSNGQMLKACLPKLAKLCLRK